MTQELSTFIREHDIQLVSEILDKKNGSDVVGYQLLSPSLSTHDITKQNLEFFIKNFKQPYYLTDGYNFKEGKHDLFIHNI